jgi:hypothetical protein
VSIIPAASPDVCRCFPGYSPENTTFGLAVEPAVLAAWQPIPRWFPLHLQKMHGTGLGDAWEYGPAAETFPALAV